MTAPLPPHHFLTATTALTGADAVAALLVLDDGRYLMQLRDDIPEIFYPGHWGCFGGAVDDGEAPLAALARELHEELELTPRDPAYFTRFDFDLSELGLRRFYRIYYEVRLRAGEEAQLRLHEGESFAAFPGEAIFGGLRVAPYDAFALFLHFARGRVGPVSQQTATDR